MKKAMVTIIRINFFIRSSNLDGFVKSATMSFFSVGQSFSFALTQG
jgi:hypothetical protein